MQYDRDIKDLQKQNETAIDRLQKAHNESLLKLTSDHNSLLNGLKKELREKEKLIMEQSKQKQEKVMAKKDHSLEQIQPIPSIAKTKELEEITEKEPVRKQQKVGLSYSEETQQIPKWAPETKDTKEKVVDRTEKSRLESSIRKSSIKRKIPRKPDLKVFWQFLLFLIAKNITF